MPIWLLIPLFALAGVATVKAVSAIAGSSSSSSGTATGGCVSPSGPPPTNPFFASTGKSIDYNKLQAAWGQVRDQGYDQADQYLNAITKIAAVVPVYGWYVAAAAQLVKGVVDMIGAGSDANSSAQRDRCTNESQSLVAMGFIPAMPAEKQTLRSLADHMAFQNGTIATREPYVRWLIQQGGALFKKWGGVKEVFALGTRFVVDTKPDAEGVIMITLSSAPAVDVRDGMPDLPENHPRLALAALCIAAEYDVYPCANQIVAAAMKGNDDYKTPFAWKRGVVEAQPDTPLDAWDLQFPDQDQGLAMFGGQVSMVTYYAYAAGIHAAINAACALSGKPPLWPITSESAMHTPGDGYTPPSPSAAVDISKLIGKGRIILPR